MADVCFQYGGGAVIREKFNFGQFPIMLKVSGCICFLSISLELLYVLWAMLVSFNLECDCKSNII